MNRFIINLSILEPVADPVRDSLQAIEGKRFHWLLISCAAVFVGVALEAPEASITLSRWYRLRRGRKVSEPDEKHWSIPVAYLGLLLVMLGVVGEGIFEALVSSANTDVRARDNQILAQAQKDAGDAKGSAVQAANASDRANKSADKASTASSHALDLASGARKETDTFQAGLVAATAKATAAESHLNEALGKAARATEELELLMTPRSLINLKAINVVLSPYSGTRYVFAGVFQDQESITLLFEINEALSAAGWTRVAVPKGGGYGDIELTLSDSFRVPVYTGSGVRIVAQSAERGQPTQIRPISEYPPHVRAALALKQILGQLITPHQTDLFYPIEVSTGDSESVLIYVGKKP